MNFKTILIGFPGFIFFLSSCMSGSYQDDFLTKLPDISHKTSNEVIAILHEPDTIYTKTLLKIKYTIYLYKNHQTEIRLLHDTVAGIIINEPYPIKFEPKEIEKFGLSYRAPDSYDPQAMIIWKGFDHIKSLSFYLVGTPKPDSIEHNFKIYFNMEK